ncbi:hypothetical protein GALMADRAFT_937347 [Galerina marginata CBS 339.88]|uniref:Uncharacterized protein n=1 Tax=Galerina marginata (strain CBS 339.88) TaxID=685588 RepID=A0A067SQE6_GALM3|nr:hypothetical protein GALMADRAFT_937347 [Galerina marginata CBS 339.88]
MLKYTRIVLFIFVILCLGEFGSEFYSSYVVAAQTSKDAFAFPAGLGVSWPGCLTAPQPRKPTLISWIPCICVAWAFFLASLLRFRHSFRNALVLRGAMAGEKKSTLVMVLIRDGTVYFCLILSILLVCTSVTLIGNGQLYPMASPWLIDVYSFSATQLILNLRKASNQEGISSSIRFKESGRGPMFAHSTVNTGGGHVVENLAALPDPLEA